MNMRSPAFNVGGLGEVFAEFYPNGIQGSPQNQSVVRFMVPQNTRIRYQCWFGSLTSGPREFMGDGQLWIDVAFEDVQNEIEGDDRASITFEVLFNFDHTDDSLAK